MHSRRCSARATMLRIALRTRTAEDKEKEDVRGVDKAAGGEEGEDVPPVHRPESVLHAPRSRGPLIRQEGEDVDEDGAGVADEQVRRGECHAIEIRVRVEPALVVTRRVVAQDGLAELHDLVREGPLGDRAVDERPLCPCLVAVVAAEEVRGEVERAGGAEDADEAGVLCQLGVQGSGDMHAPGGHCVGVLWRVCVALSPPRVR